jgi:thioesterase domain-containing protein/acyl carrier protein
LGIAEVDLSDRAELSSLGLDSLVQAELRQSLEKHLGVTLPAEVFLRYPTIEQLAANLPPATIGRPFPPTSSTSPTPLTICHEHGRHAPSFWIHGAPGDTNWLLSLSQALGPEFPLFGIEAVESTSYSSIEELATQYLNIIRATAPTDRYRIGGYSFGGAVAVEICRQLEQQGGRIEDLILFDTYAPGSMDLHSLKGNLLVSDPAFASLLIGNMLVQRWNVPQILEFADFQGLDFDEHVEVIVKRVGQYSPLKREQLVRAIRKASQFAARHDKLLNAYQPQPLHCHAKVTLFRAALGFTAPDNVFALPAIASPVGDSPDRWRSLLGTDVVVHEIACDHFGLLSEPETSGVAAALREILGDNPSDL